MNILEELQKSEYYLENAGTDVVLMVESAKYIVKLRRGWNGIIVTTIRGRYLRSKGRWYAKQEYKTVEDVIDAIKIDIEITNKAKQNKKRRQTSAIGLAAIMLKEAGYSITKRGDYMIVNVKGEVSLYIGEKNGGLVVGYSKYFEYYGRKIPYDIADPQNRALSTLKEIVDTHAKYNMEISNHLMKNTTK